MAVKKAAATRRQRNRELAIEDARRRCANCRIAIPKDSGFSKFLTPELRYCSADCLAAAEERLELLK